MPSIKDLPEQERPREKLIERGSAALSDQELLAIILGRGTQKHGVMSLSRRIITILDRQGLTLKAADLLEVEGIGLAKATLIAAAFEFVRRRVRPEGVRIREAKEVLPLIQHYADRKQEHFIVISLNGAHEVLTTRVVTIGLVDQSHVHPREVFADPLTERASAIVVAHNHPSGQLIPSPEDLDVTHRIKVAGDILGIELLDHVLFTRKGFYSFAEHGQV